jgi:iron complex outermembrane receptor protein
VKLRILAASIAVIGLNGNVIAQSSDAATARVEITGSSIKRIQKEGALPVEVISRDQIDKAGIVTAEQLIMRLTSNSNGSENLASNSDVTSGAQRGNNGASSANLRGQGADSTLVLLNGRRVATHGMKGQAVDINSIPMAAVDRVEVLKDGASAIYGTDAIGGVINFILRKNYTGLEVQAFTDITERAGGEINRLTVTGGYGDLDKDKFNVLMTFAHSENSALRGDQRGFVNTFQPDRGLSVDTRGTPLATIFSRAGSLLPTSPKDKAGLTVNGINPLDLPGGAGCSSVDGMGPYDENLWADQSTKYGCAWDTGRAAVLQQPVDNTNYVVRGTWKINEHQITAEAVGSHVEVAKSFSPYQISSAAGNATTAFGLASYYPLNAKTKTTYDSIYNQMLAEFPAIAANYGNPIAYRWRCMPCGNREIRTETDADRFLLGADGPIGTWDYRVGLSRATSESVSVIGNGYYYFDKFRAALGSGDLNPFSLTQSQAGIDAIKAASATGAVLYGGKTTVTEFDATFSGEVFQMPAGAAMAAVGFDQRKEEYAFNGSLSVANGPSIYLAPFDTQNDLTAHSRTIKAVFAEVMLPVTKSLELTGAVRYDDYSGFGSTTNPKVSFRFTPFEQLLFRGSYNTGFRVPAFNQIFNLPTETQYVGKDLIDPANCLSGKVNLAIAGCGPVTPIQVTGGKADLGPETAKQGSVGMVWAPIRDFSLNLDYWDIKKEDTIQSISLADLLANYSSFPERFLRDSSNTLIAIDQRWVNSGGSQTRGVEVGAKANGKIGAALWSAGIDGSYLLEKKSRVLPSVPYGSSEVGRFVFSGDLGLRWKHTAYFNYQRGDWTTTLTQIYRSGYKDQVLPGVLNGAVHPANWKEKVDAYQIFNISATYAGIKNMSITAGIQNLLDKDPPFAVTYDSNTGAGSSWEPRVADPRGRSYTLLLNYKFF